MSGFSDPRSVPTVSIRGLIRSVLSKTVDEMRLLQRELRQKTANERRLLASRAFKLHRHRLLQLYALLSWCKRMGLLSNVGVMESGPLMACKDAELKVLAQLDALQQALLGFPHLAGQAADHVNGLRHLQYTVMLSGKSVLFDVDTSLDILCNGTYSRFPRLSDGPLAVPPPSPGDNDVLFPPVHSPEVVRELNSALRLKLLSVDIPRDFSPIVVEDGCLFIGIPGLFTAKLSTRSVALESPWRVESLSVSCGEDAVQRLPPFHRFVALPEPGHVTAIMRLLNGRLREQPTGNPLTIVWGVLKPVLSALMLESLFVQASLLATAASVTAIAAAKEKAKAEASGFAKRSLRQVASGQADTSGGIADAIVDVTGWGAGHLRVRRSTTPPACLRLILWPLNYDTNTLVAVDSPEAVQALAGAVVVTISDDFTYRSSINNHVTSMIRHDAPWISVQHVLEHVTCQAVKALTAAIRVDLSAAGVQAVSHSVLMGSSDGSPRLVLLPVGGGLSLRVDINDRTGFPTLAVTPLDASTLVASDELVCALEQQCLSAEQALHRGLRDAVAHELRVLQSVPRPPEDAGTWVKQYQRFLSDGVPVNLRDVDHFMAVGTAVRFSCTVSVTVAAVLPLVENLRSTARRHFVQQSLLEIGATVVPIASSSFTNLSISSSPYCADDATLPPLDPLTCLASFVVTAPAHAKRESLSFPQCLYRSDGCVTYQVSSNAVFVELCCSDRYDILLVVDVTTPGLSYHVPSYSHHIVVTSPVETASVEVFDSVSSAGRRLPVLTLAAPFASASSSEGPPAVETRESTIVFSEEAAAIARSVVSADIVSSGGGYRNLVRGRREDKRDDGLLVDGAAFRPEASSSMKPAVTQANPAASRFPVVPWDFSASSQSSPYHAVLLLQVPFDFPPQTAEQIAVVDSWLADVVARAVAQSASAVVVLSSSSSCAQPPAVFLPHVTNSTIPVVWAFGAAAKELSKATGDCPTPLFGRVHVSLSPKRRVVGMWSLPIPTLPRLAMKRARSGSTSDTPGHDTSSPLPSAPLQGDDDVSYVAELAEIAERIPGLTDFLQHQFACSQPRTRNGQQQGSNGKRPQDGLDSPRSSALSSVVTHSSTSRELHRTTQAFASSLRAVRTYGLAALKVSRLALLAVTAHRFGCAVSEVGQTSIRCQFSVDVNEFSFVVTLSLTGWRVAITAGSQSQFVEYSPVTNTSQTFRTMIIDAAKLARYPGFIFTVQALQADLPVENITVSLEGEVALELVGAGSTTQRNAVHMTLCSCVEGQHVTASALAAHIMAVNHVALVSCHGVPSNIVDSINHVVGTTQLAIPQQLDLCLRACQMALLSSMVSRELIRDVLCSPSDFRNAVIHDRSGRMPLLAMRVVAVQDRTVSVSCANPGAVTAFQAAISLLKLAARLATDGSLVMTVDELRRFVHHFVAILSAPRVPV